jgi:hypothetical protein
MTTPEVMLSEQTLPRSRLCVYRCVNAHKYRILQGFSVCASRHAAARLLPEMAR